MKALIVGGGKGSWTMRGQQLGAAIGATVTSAPTVADFEACDVVVLIKRAGERWAADAHRHGRPIVWDALDCWSQPADNRAGARQALEILRRQIAAIQPALVIGATAAMATAAEGVYLPHHSWAGLEPTPAREAIATVAYEGNPAYLGQWAAALKAACKRRGWRFVINPPDLRAADLVVAFRDGAWDGWICRQWKSGVKVVNAIAAGRPFIAQASAAVAELQPDGSTVEAAGDLEAALEAWEPQAARAAVVERARRVAPAFTLATIAADYQRIVASKVLSCAA